MPEDDKKKKKYTRKDKKADKKKAKIESGMYAANRKKAKRKAKRIGSKEPDYSESATGAAIKDAVHNVGRKLGLTKKRYRTKKVAPGNVGDKVKGTSYKRVPKPVEEGVEIGIKNTEGKRTIGGKSKVISTYDSGSSTKKGIEAKKKEGEAKTGTKFKGDATTEGGKRVLKRNEEEQSAYQRKKKALKKEKEKGKYVDGSRTRETSERQGKNVEEFKRKGARASYKRRKKELKSERLAEDKTPRKKSKILNKKGNFKRRRRF